MPRGRSLGTANLDNTTRYEDADKHLKCLYYAFANAEGLTVDGVYSTNVKLMTDVHWDDSYMAVKLAHRYGYRIHPGILYFSEVVERFTNASEKLIVLHHLNGPLIAVTMKKVVNGKETDKEVKVSFTHNKIVDILKLPAFEKTEWHAISGDIQGKGSIKWKSFDENFNGPPANKQCIVFVKNK